MLSKKNPELSIWRFTFGALHRSEATPSNVSATLHPLRGAIEFLFLLRPGHAGIATATLPLGEMQRMARRRCSHLIKKCSTIFHATKSMNIHAGNVKR